MGTEPNRTNQGTECKGTAREAGKDTGRDGGRREQYHTSPSPAREVGERKKEGRTTERWDHNGTEP